MNETTMTLVGNAATEVKYRETPAGIPVASFRLASTVRRWDRERSCWTDAHTSFYTVWAWRGLAGNVAGSISKGDPLIVRGRVRVSEWEKDGKRHTSVEIEAGAIGHDLSRGTSAFRRGPYGRQGATTEGGPDLVSRQQGLGGGFDGGGGRRAPERHPQSAGVG